MNDHEITNRRLTCRQSTLANDEWCHIHCSFDYARELLDWCRARNWNGHPVMQRKFVRAMHRAQKAAAMVDVRAVNCVLARTSLRLVMSVTQTDGLAAPSPDDLFLARARQLDDSEREVFFRVVHYLSRWSCGELERAIQAESIE